MSNFLRTFLSRLIGAAVGAGAGVLAQKTGIDLPAETQASITGAVVVGVYGVTHKLLDKKLNPLDTASRTASRELGHN